MKTAILFVCLGNICRSPLAEAAMRQRAAERDLDIRIDSAGTASWHIGKSPDPRGQQTGRRHGVDMSAYRARQVGPADFHEFHHIVAMDQNNLEDLQSIKPDGACAILSLALDHVAGRTGQSVDDPYYGDADGFETTWADVSAMAHGLANRLVNQS